MTMHRLLSCLDISCVLPQPPLSVVSTVGTEDMTKSMKGLGLESGRLQE